MSENVVGTGLPSTSESLKLNQNIIRGYEFETRESVDITSDFFIDCSKLLLGELAMCPTFTLMDCMSSIELMDPKMDQGMKPIDETLGLEKAIQLGKVNIKSMPLKEQIAVFDATMACLVSFLKSNSLDQTVYTNILLNNPELIEDEILKAITTGLLQMTRTLKFIIDLGGISFDEDITLACRADETMLSSVDNDNAIVFLKNVEKKIEKKLKTSAEKAILHRLKFLRLFLETCACIVPPSSVLAPDSEEAFVVNFKVAAVCLSALINSFSVIEKSITEGLSPSENEKDGDYSWLSSFQPDVNRHLIPNSFPRAPLIDDRITAYKFWKILLENMANMVRELPLKVGTIEDLLVCLIF